MRYASSLADFAQLGRIVFPHAQRHAPDRAEQIGEHRDAAAFGFLEQQRRAARAQHTVGDFSHFEFGVDFDGDAFQLAEAFELGNEIAQVVIFHEVRMRSRSAVVLV